MIDNNKNEIMNTSTVEPKARFLIETPTSEFWADDYIMENNAGLTYIRGEEVTIIFDIVVAIHDYQLGAPERRKINLKKFGKMKKDRIERANEINQALLTQKLEELKKVKAEPPKQDVSFS
jgi:hypothetical protein